MFLFCALLLNSMHLKRAIQIFHICLSKRTYSIFSHNWPTQRRMLRERKSRGKSSRRYKVALNWPSLTFWPSIPSSSGFEIFLAPELYGVITAGGLNFSQLLSLSPLPFSLPPSPPSDAPSAPPRFRILGIFNPAGDDARGKGISREKDKNVRIFCSLKSDYVVFARPLYCIQHKRYSQLIISQQFLVNTKYEYKNKVRQCSFRMIKLTVKETTLKMTIFY